MKTTQIMDKQLKSSAILFFIFLAFFAVAIAIMVFYIVGLADVMFMVIASVLYSVGYILFLISLFKNQSYRKSCLVPGKLSTLIYVMDWIFLFPFMVIWVLMALLSGGSSELRKVTIKDEQGNVYNLTQTFIGSNEYRDQNGDLWKTYDEKTFERVNFKATDDKGNEKTLTPTYESMFTKHYTDENGEEYKSDDGGNTFDHVVTHATVKDKDGNEYELRAIQAGLDTFIDQNGDTWITFDGGKTFERR